MDMFDPIMSIRCETGLNNHPSSINQDGLKNGPKKAHAVLCSLLSRLSSSVFVLSECIIKGHELIIADVQSFCSVWAIIFPSSYLLEFDGKHWLHHNAPSLSFSLALSLSLMLSLSPSLLLSISASPVYLYDGWAVVLLSDLSALEAFMLIHRVLPHACIYFFLTENKHNKLLK